MIITKVYLRPHGDETQDRQIGEMKIWNNGSGCETLGNYFCSLFLDGKEIAKGKVNNFRRLDENVFELMFRCLYSARKDGK